MLMLRSLLCAVHIVDILMYSCSVIYLFPECLIVDKKITFEIILNYSLYLNVHVIAIFYRHRVKMADGEDIQPLVCDNGTGMVKVYV